MKHTPMPTLTAAPPSALDDLTDEIWEAICNEQDMDTSLMDFAKAVVRNVPLVKAAPELLAALQKFVLAVEGDGNETLYPASLRDARAAIARATGDK